MLRCGVVTIFPEMFLALNYGMTSRALQKGLLAVDYFNPRDFAVDVHRSVDDRPYGGGPGMVMKPEPLIAAIAAARASAVGKKVSSVGAGEYATGVDASSSVVKTPKVIYLSPQGKTVDQRAVEGWLDHGSLVLVAGRYEGIDERVCALAIDEEWSLGDYVLSGGEFAAMVVIDALARLIPGVLGDAESKEQDSFTRAGLLDWPHYTRPAEYAGLGVPEVLLSGDHAAIQRWRVKQQLERTWQRRPDLLAKSKLSAEEERILAQVQAAVGSTGADKG